MTALISVLISVLVLVTTIHYSDTSLLSDFKNETIKEFKEKNTVKRHKRQGDSHAAEGDKDGFLQEFPHIVAVTTTPEGRGCLGVLLTEKFVGGSAHCLRSSISVAVHGEKIDDFIRIIHSFYNARTKYYDVGLLMLAANVNIQRTVVPGCLWMDDNISIANVKIVGSNEFFDTKSITQTTRITLQNAEKCQPYTQYIERLVGYSVIDQHICAFYEFEEQWRLRDGIMYLDLIYDNHIVPFVIGSASFVPIGGLHRLQGFTQLFKFGDWIAETMRERGGVDLSFNPLICAKRHLEYRRQINNTSLYGPTITVDSTVSIHSHPDSSHTKICVGVLISKDAVITLAQCASNLMSYISRVVLADGSFITIRDIIIHPDYSGDSLYSNIAILKLVSEASVTPIEIAPYYSKHDKITLYASVINGDQSKNNKFFAVDGLNVQFSYECNLSEEHRSRLLKGLHPEHMCLQNNRSLVPGSCEAHPGSAIYWYRNDKKYLLGLYMLGENCAVGDQALGLYVYAYNAWVHSVLDTPLQKSHD